MDNYFSNVPLFKALLADDIGAMGTVRPNAEDFPEILKVEKAQARKHLPWGYYTGVIVGDGDVFASIWQDNNTVNLLTSIHDFNSFTLATRRRPKNTSTNAKQSQKLFDIQGVTVHTKRLAIPQIIDEYNHHRNGVDNADQV